MVIENFKDEVMKAQQLFTILLFSLLSLNVFAAKALCGEDYNSYKDAVYNLNVLLAKEGNITISTPMLTVDKHGRYVVCVSIRSV